MPSLLEQLGAKLGYWASYLIFTTVLYFILSILNRIPPTWDIGHIAVITLGITTLSRWVTQVFSHASFP